MTAQPADEATTDLSAVLADPLLIEKVRWNILHYGPLNAEPFQFSRFESVAHAALEPVAEALAPVIREARAAALDEAAAATVRDWEPVFYVDEDEAWANDKVARWLNRRAEAERGGSNG